MTIRARLIVLTIFVSACALYGQKSGTIRLPDGRLKVENGLIISWNAISTDPEESAVEISDQGGRPLVGLKILPVVLDTRLVGIHDVSAMPGKLIAVAAVYVSKQAIPNAARLLLFDFNGRLRSSLPLDPVRYMARLEVDDSSNIWTMTGSANGQNPATLPLVIEYRPDGSIEKELIPRSRFPLHAADLKEDLEIGSVAMGYHSGVIWFWLPGSTDLVTIPADRGGFQVVETQLPRTPTRKVVPMHLFRQSSGDLVAEFHEDGPDGEMEIRDYVWSATKKSWSESQPESCVGGRLIGDDATGRFYLQFASTEVRAETADLCIERH